MIFIVFITIIVLIIVLFASVFVYLKYQSIRYINVEKINLNDLNKNKIDQENEENKPTKYFDLYFTDSSSVFPLSGLTYDIYLDLKDGTRISTNNNKKIVTPIEFSESWLYKRIELKQENLDIVNVVFDFVYIDIVYSQDQKYRIYMHDNDMFRMGEIIKYDFNKTMYWFDLETEQWTKKRTNHVYTAPIMQYLIKLSPDKVIDNENKLIMQCPIAKEIHLFLEVFASKVDT